MANYSALSASFGIASALIDSLHHDKLYMRPESLILGDELYMGNERQDTPVDTQEGRRVLERRKLLPPLPDVEGRHRGGEGWTWSIT